MRGFLVGLALAISAWVALTAVDMPARPRSSKQVARSVVVYVQGSEYPTVHARYFADDGTVCESVGTVVIPRGALLDCAWRGMEAAR